MTGLRTGLWSDREVRHLRELSVSGTPTVEIAQALGRTPRAVKEKLIRSASPRERRTVGPPLASDEGCTRAKAIDINSDFLAALAAERHGARAC